MAWPDQVRWRVHHVGQGIISFLGRLASGITQSAR